MAILESMLARLHQALLGGPALNARPHNIRQRIEWTQCAQFGAALELDLLAKLLANGGKIDLPVRVPAFTKSGSKRGRRRGSSSRRSASFRKPGLWQSSETA